jgi:FlaG/FlaF family flagellin (archaellin)
VTTPAAVWIIVGVVSTLAIVVVLVGLVRHVLLLGRTLRRFQEEVQPIAEDIAAEGERASSRAGGPPTGKPR